VVAVSFDAWWRGYDAERNCHEFWRVIAIEESQLPVRDEVRGACEILGLDPLYVANEGKLIGIVAPEVADRMVAQMRQHPLGQEARIIGEVQAEPQGLVILMTTFGGTRIIDMLVGEQLPRIC
jgi:hydrogenase expression/formation protein HypE